MSSWWGVILVLVLLALNAFFVGSEFALVSARRSQMEIRAESGSKAARTAVRAMEQVSLVMAGAQLGITICSLLLGAVGEPAVAHLIEPVIGVLGVPDAWLHPIAFVIALTLVVFLHVVFGEMVPKNIAIAGPERAAMVLGGPMLFTVMLIKPIVLALNGMANGVLRLVRVEPREEVSSTFTHDEVEAMIEQSRQEGLIPDEESDLLAGAVGFSRRTVSSVTLPLSDLAVIPRSTRVSAVEALCAQTGFSRFPVINREGQPIGYVHIKDVLEVSPGGWMRRLSDKWIRPFATLQSGDTLQTALSLLQQRGSHMGKVTDTSGNVVGIVTLEDIIEELVGHIQDAAHPERDSI